jgi:hypothetical protein
MVAAPNRDLDNMADIEDMLEPFYCAADVALLSRLRMSRAFAH